MGFWQTIIAGTLSMLAGTLILWLLDLWYLIIEYFKSASIYAINLFNYKLNIPLWIILISMILILHFINFRINREKNSIINKTITEVELSFTKNEELVIQLLAALDGAFIGLVEIADRIKCSKLITEQAIDELLQKDFLLDNNNYIHGRTYRLSRNGRNYAITKGYVY